MTRTLIIGTEFGPIRVEVGESDQALFVLRGPSDQLDVFLASVLPDAWSLEDVAWHTWLDDIKPLPEIVKNSAR